jgi:hypothetical protein
MKKTLISLSLVVLLLISFTTPAASSSADDVIAELRAIQAAFPGNAQVARLVSAARTWLSDPVNAATITPDAAGTISGNIANARATVGSATALSELSEAQANAVVSSVAAAANAANLRFSASISGNDWTFVLTDAAGNVIASATNADPIKQTGMDSILLIVGIIIFSVAMLFGAVIIISKTARKKRLIFGV